MMRLLPRDGSRTLSDSDCTHASTEDDGGNYARTNFGIQSRTCGALNLWLIASPGQDWGPGKEHFHCVLEERRNGVMVTTRDVSGDSDEPVCELPLSWFQKSNE